MLKRILNARVRDVLPTPTPLQPAPLLTTRLGHDILLKREDLTPVFSFKLRGAYNRIAALSTADRELGLIAASAGNHAQGVAYAANLLGVPCTIVMPKTTPEIKVAAVRRLGAEVVMHGDNYSDAAERCAELQSQQRMNFIHPFDDLDVIAGQGTVAVEILSQAPDNLGSIFVPVGGGGLAAGVGAYIKAVRPDIAVIGVEPEASDAMTQSLEAGERVHLDHVGIFADGVAVRQVGEHTFHLCREVLDDCIRVSDDEICAAIKDCFEETRTVLEGAGALSIAGLKRYADEQGLPAGPAAAIASGANLSFNRLRYITERTDLGEHREGFLAVEIPERPGCFRAFHDALGALTVTEFSYRLSRRDVAHILVGIAPQRADEIDEIAGRLRSAGYCCADLTDNEFAKIHVRHLVGGRSTEVQDEVLYDFEFPERTGALRDFLGGLGDRWNISLFHYRNHGGSYGQVLCGFEVPEAERDQLAATLGGLGFHHREQTADPAVEMFLR